MDTKSITSQAEQYVRDYFDLHPNGKLLYHNLYHTEMVAKAARQIGQNYPLADTDLLIVVVAAWFHDIGYLQGGVTGHEARGAEMAAAYLQGNGVDASIVESIRKCILATELPQRAVTPDEQIVCDADLFHLGTDEFGERNKLLRKEAEALKGKKVVKEDWRKDTIRFLEAHQYYTDYCRNLLSGGQLKNLEELRAKEEAHQGDGGHRNHGSHGDHGGHGDHGSHGDHGGHGDHGEHGDHGDHGDHGSHGDHADREGTGKVEESKEGSGVRVEGGKVGGGKVGGDKLGGGTDKLESILHRHLEEIENSGPTVQTAKGTKKKDPGRSIDTVFRITSQNNQRLSSQADSKAHILIQVNAIIISVLLSLLLRRIEDYTNLAIPSVLLLTVNLITIIFSILATRPQIPPGRFTRADLDEKRVNLLFFGNFYRMSLEEYAGGMLQMMEDRDFLYGSLIRDVYFQGIALGRKYRLLRWSYNVFMYGLIASVTAFIIAALVFPVK